VTPPDLCLRACGEWLNLPWRHVADLVNAGQLRTHEHRLAATTAHLNRHPFELRIDLDDLLAFEASLPAPSSFLPVPLGTVPLGTARLGMAA